MPEFLIGIPAASLMAGECVVGRSGDRWYVSYNVSMSNGGRHILLRDAGGDCACILEVSPAHIVQTLVIADETA